MPDWQPRKSCVRATTGRRWRNVAFGALFLAMFATLLWLGFWQMQRLAWKEGLIARQEAVLKKSPLSLEQFDALDEGDWQFQPLRVSGKPLWEKTIWLGPRPRDNGITWEWLVPLIASDAPYAGRHLLVNMGYVTDEQRKAWNPGQLPDTLTITGGVRISQHPHWRTAENQPDKNFWQLLYVEQIASTLHLKPFLPFAVQAWQTSPVVLPDVLAFLPRTITLRNQHRQYAITWFTLAGCLLAGLVYACVRQRREAR